MAANAAEIITLGEMFTQLRLRDNSAVGSPDVRISFLEGIRDSAVAAVETHTRRTLVDKNNVVESFRMAQTHRPYRIRADGVRIDSTDVNAKSADADVEYIDEELNARTLTCKLVADTYQGSPSALLYPPEGECWPRTADYETRGGVFRITLTLRGPAAADIPPDLKRAALMLSNVLFHGGALDTIPPHNPVTALMAQHVRYVG